MPVAFLVAPVLAAIASVAVSAKIDVPVTNIYVPVVVFGTGVDSLDGGHPIGLHPISVTKAQIDRVRAELTAYGIDDSRAIVWRERAHDALDETAPVEVGIILLDLGAPARAREMLPALSRVRQEGFAFGWRLYADVDCSALRNKTLASLRERARVAAANYAHARVGAISFTTDPRNSPFAMLPLCPAAVHPFIGNTGMRAPTSVPSSIVSYVAGSATLSYRARARAYNTPPGAVSIFPFSTFGFASPIIGQQEHAYTLHGRFAATPGASQVSARADAAVVDLPFTAIPAYVAALRIIRSTGLASRDIFADDATRHIFVRLSPVSRKVWRSIQPLARGNERTYVYLNNCSRYASFARDVALARSRELAAAGASALHMPLGSLVVQTDYAGPSTDASCGWDASEALSKVAAGLASARYTMGSPFFADFWDSIYAAWTLGSKTPRIVSSHIVGRTSHVVFGDGRAVRVKGAATIHPDAYFFQDNRYTSSGWSFKTHVVTSLTQVPKGKSAGNVVTNCDAAQDRALANALRVAAFDGPIRSFYAAPARFLSIACYSRAAIGGSFQTLPTVYNATSDTGTALVTDEATVFR